MPEKPYKSRLCGQFIPHFCADFVPKPIIHAKNCLLLQGQSKTKNEKTLEKSRVFPWSKWRDSPGGAEGVPAASPGN